MLKYATYRYDYEVHTNIKGVSKLHTKANMKQFAHNMSILESCQKSTRNNDIKSLITTFGTTFMQIVFSN